MTLSVSPPNAIAPFLATTRTYPSDETERIITHEQTYTEVAQAVNFREIGIYALTETMTGKQWFDVTDSNNFRFSYRTCFTLPFIATSTEYTFAHHLTPPFQVTNLYGFAITTASDQRPLPYVGSIGTDMITLLIDDTLIWVENGEQSPDLNSSFIVVEYIYT